MSYEEAVKVIRKLEQENEKLVEENSKLTAQKIIFQRSYKQLLEQNKKLKELGSRKENI